MHKRFIRNLFDLFFYEEGCFSMLNCFLKEGYLDYDVYLRWRAGKIDYLEQEFSCPPEICTAFLTEVNDYAAILEVAREAVDYFSTDNQTLRFSPDSKRDADFKILYTPAVDRVQLDLFFDSAETGLTVELTNAVIHGETQRVEYLLAALRRTDSNKARNFERMLKARDAIVADTLTADEKLHLMEHEIMLPTLELMGHCANDFLIPLWRKMAEDFSDYVFDPNKPNSHASYCAFKGLQWQETLQAVERQRDWRRHPILLHRYAEACFKIQNELEGLRCWFRLFLFFPEAASELITKTAYRLLQEDWRQFQSLDPELEKDLFPAWVLTKKPMLAKHAFEVDAHSASAEALTRIIELLRTDDNRLDRNTLTKRAELKRCYPSLFEHYMNMR